MSPLNPDPKPPRRLKVPVPPPGKLTARILGPFRLGRALAIVGLGLAGFVAPIGASASPNPSAAIGTPLPPGWERCVLQGVGAPVTADDVANLDAWQLAEGGSTNNTAAYNPFNTRQATDSTGTPLPVDTSVVGFPAFATWTAGCAATVATLLNSDMAPIVTALKAGDVSPPGLFLSDVDKSAWCAPSADGIPCYAQEVLAGELLGALLTGSAGQLKDAVLGYSNTSTDLKVYEEAAFVTAADLNVLTAKTEQLTVAQNSELVAQGKLSAATRALRRLAIDAYTSHSVVSVDSNLQLFGPPDEQGVVGQYYGNVAVAILIDGYDRAVAAVKTSVSQRLAAAASVTQATSVRDSAEAAESQALSRLEADVKSIEAARACSTPSLATPAALSVAGQGTPGQLWAALQDCLGGAPVSGAPPQRIGAFVGGTPTAPHT
jgi:hypothetical protein